MMTKELKWRLKDLPDASGVAELVKQAVMTQDEARELLFNNKSTDTSKVEALEKQIEFLEELVKDLAKNNTNVSKTTIFETVKRYQPYYYPQVWMSTTGTTTGPISKVLGGGVNGALNNTTLTSYTQKLIS